MAMLDRGKWAVIDLPIGGHLIGGHRRVSVTHPTGKALSRSEMLSKGSNNRM
jgi:hypothetical protein